MWFRPSILVATLTLGGTYNLTWGQAPVTVQGGTPAGLTPVEQGVADLGPLGLSFRRLQLDLRRPTGFDRVFQFVGPTGQGITPASSSSGQLARVSGALSAVFPRSSYVTTSEGQTFAAIPAGTRFVIGDPARTIGTVPNPTPTAAPSHLALHTAVNNAASGRVDRAADRGASTASPATPSITPITSPPARPEADSAPPSIVDDERLRVRRVKALLADAAATPPKAATSDS